MSEATRPAGLGGCSGGSGAGAARRLHGAAAAASLCASQCLQPDFGASVVYHSAELYCSQPAQPPLVLVPQVPLNATTGGCVGKPAGLFPPWTLDGPTPWPPYCPTSFLDCDGDGTGVWVRDGLGSIALPGGAEVPAVFNW